MILMHTNQYMVLYIYTNWYIVSLEMAQYLLIGESNHGISWVLYDIDMVGYIYDTHAH